MGGDFYDRPVIEAKNPEQNFSDNSNKIFSSNQGLHKSNDPKRFYSSHLICKNKNPLIFALDVTGSMGDWSKIIYDKLPMFYGQIMIQKYLEDPAISFCAIGDVTHDRAPLQITEFGQGSQLDQLISKIYLEGGGGNNLQESYELAAYFYVNHCEIPKSELPYFFITGDELFFDTITGFALSKIFGKHQDKFASMKKMSSNEIWTLLMEKFNVFHLHKPFKKKYMKSNQDDEIINQWKKALGKERILEMHTPKACIDVILGAIAITSGARTLEEYVKDMETRGQEKGRIEEVVNALKNVKIAERKQNVETKDEIEKKQEIEKEHLNKKNEPEEEKKNVEFDRFFDLDYVRKFIKENMIDWDYSSETLAKRDENERKLGANAPKCPIMDRLFIDPAIAEDGNTYEMKAIKTWLAFYDTSPLTGMKMGKKLMNNQEIMKKINVILWENLNEDYD